MSDALSACLIAGLDTNSWSIVFEYELPFENGRRPDVVVLAGASIVVIEFKSAPQYYQAHADQVEAYARDILEYHEASRGRNVTPVLVLRDVSAVRGGAGPVRLTDPGGIDGELSANCREGSIDLGLWLRSAYAPLPTLVAAARRIFRHEALPHVRRALSHGVPRTVELVRGISDHCELRAERALVLVTGVPGAGKTLVGLRAVYERSDIEAKATFLSGNGPLVKVLQDALKSRVFVRDLHAFIKTFGIQGKTPSQHLIVFDEAQRAWDRRQMHRKHGIDRSEPDLLIEAAERVPGWSVIVGLVGEGQEIHTGEESGLTQWRDALLGRSETWHVYCPPHVEELFDGLRVDAKSNLVLPVSLRSHRAEDLHEWVRRVLRGGLDMAAQLASRFATDDSYHLYLTRELSDAREYVRIRYADEPDKTYGLMASSHSWRFFEPQGIRHGFRDSQRLNVARWFNASADDPESGCALQVPVTEFQCQGLEVDMPIVCWGTDYAWHGGQWIKKPIQRRPPLDHPDQILENAYRVLLTRGRDGVVIFVPPVAELDETVGALIGSGVEPLPEPSQLPGQRPIAGAGVSA